MPQPKMDWIAQAPGFGRLAIEAAAPVMGERMPDIGTVWIVLARNPLHPPPGVHHHG
ncbi:hypothetical protein M4R22_09700 [Acidovorax sp. GBBC 3334]|uniref:hypothetical protein n=1 Tax=unclassified Acidovorax TaxID=2684926 RepID=UPI002304C11B|nr:MULTISPECIES: hypothetical protein [unclassified Acidovorax]MDA8455038.1 hypothetical protein [Acidovorax sp. GBBC 3334]MDA8523408.1 hypothetical protein [Acidovorax sp. NCPPB 4044]